METAGARLKVFWAKSFAWTAETHRPQVVGGGGALPLRKEMKESEDGRSVLRVGHTRNQSPWVHVPAVR